MDEPVHSIQVVAERTGLSAHVIRAWERRYGAVNPQRKDSGRRLYSENEVARLELLQRLTEAGHGIGNVARLPQERLEALLAAGSGPMPGSPIAPEGAIGVKSDDLLAEALKAVGAMDEGALEAVLDRGELALGAQGVLRRLIAPLAREIGRSWREGEITAAHEHFATAVIRLALAKATKPFAASPTAPVIVVATPAGQIHELGALLAGAAAANLGWRVVYLGASLGAAEIAGAARQREARAVALSVIYPEDDAGLVAELARLRELMPDIPIVAGGRAVKAYLDAFEHIRAHVAYDIGEFGEILDALRRKP
jgi:DNA-binding transcriptional MerR regulator/methylmalonyl-CoA mutase cobalamin-binding subunit